jgi:hypothetical protein
MIEPHWEVADLDPATWRAIGHFFDPGQYIRAVQPGEHGLFLLHDNGTLLRVVDTEQGVRRDLGITQIDDVQELAQQLYEQGNWQRVHIINKRHLARVARLAQQIPGGTMHLDAYYHSVYHLLWGSDDGYVCQPPPPGHWHGWTYQSIQDAVHRLPTAATLALGVFQGTALEIGLILEWHQQTITRVTTFEALPEPAKITGVSQDDCEQLWQQLATAFVPPAGVLLCTHETFTRWIEAEEEKEGLLDEARRHGTAVWRVKM